MRVLHELSELALAMAPLEVAAGFFDGVHRGHQRVIHEAVLRAQAAGGAAWALTLEPHPLRILQPAAAPPLLTTLEQKLELIGQLGVAGCVVLEFTRALAAEEPEAFVRRLRAALPSPASLVVGANWTFGQAARGNTNVLRRLAPKLELGLRIVEPVFWTDAPISSTRIRQQIIQGHMEEAACMLGRYYSVRGAVLAGRGYGRQLGFPTANLTPVDEVLPPPGVYAASALIDGVRHLGAAFRPDPALLMEFTPPANLVEVHFLDAQLQLYDRALEVFFISRLRDVRRFDKPAALRAQIARDVEDVRRLTAAYVTPQGDLALPGQA
ncbi:MAG: bifunctional riboflavin kinase/FMN adenylyltransferase [Kiritimatiellaeota bacterium]|nr:bifunctional riboflavin kinase/FMN adenylyltransferase [Kiritimatiellota bacterium]